MCPAQAKFVSGRWWHTHTLDIVSHYAHIVRDCQKQLATGREPSSFSPINSHYSAHCSESMAILCRFSVKSEPAVKGDCLSVPPHPCGAQLTNWRTDRRCQQMMSKCEDGTAAVQASSLPSAASSANYNAIALEVCTLSDWPFTFTHCPPFFDPHSVLPWLSGPRQSALVTRSARNTATMNVAPYLSLSQCVMLPRRRPKRPFPSFSFPVKLIGKGKCRWWSSRVTIIRLNSVVTHAVAYSNSKHVPIARITRTNVCKRGQ